MSTATEAERDLLSALDFEHEMPCEWIGPHREPVCTNPARWWFRCRGCRDADPICDEHRKQWVGALVRYVRVRCNLCKRERPAALWHEVFTFEPIVER